MPQRRSTSDETERRETVFRRQLPGDGSSSVNSRWCKEDLGDRNYGMVPLRRLPLRMTSSAMVMLDRWSSLSANKADSTELGVLERLNKKPRKGFFVVSS